MHMPLPNLEAYAIPLTFPNKWDHTYVLCPSMQFTWPCWGRYEGGHLIGSAPGRCITANCIAGTDGHAGIKYGITGVCHQTANRILYPAGITVQNAGGYVISMTLYGTYGTDAQDFIGRILPGCMIQNPMDSLVTLEDNPEKNFIQNIVDLYSQPATILKNTKTDSITFLGKEFELMMSYRLGDKPDNDKIKSVLKRQADILKEKEKIVEDFNSMNLNTENFVKELNELCKDGLMNYLEILGKEDHQKLFNLSESVDNFVLVDPEIAAKAYSDHE